MNGSPKSIVNGTDSSNQASLHLIKSNQQNLTQKGDRMNVITEVVYSNEDKVTSAYFTSNEQYMEWRENYPEYEVLEILDDFVDEWCLFQNNE